MDYKTRFNTYQSLNVYSNCHVAHNRCDNVRKLFINLSNLYNFDTVSQVLRNFIVIVMILIKTIIKLYEIED